MKLISVKNLTVARGGMPVLEGLNFDVSTGEILVLRGPNGVGKTTLLRTLAGLQPPYEGTVDAAPDTVAYAAHADGLKSTLTVRENLMFWAGVYGGRDIEPALRDFNLDSLSERPAGNLSAGQKRRLGLARLMVTHRPVWVLDEPTVSLDVASVALFAAAVKAHLASGGAAIIATHIQLGFEETVFDVTPYKARMDVVRDDFDEAFL
ncbi:MULTISPECIES: heme ABC exporter ATP-binding protein CcmA [Roseobacteraceae]|uniref:Cytochrome c biogenesis protein CcmA n=1 Tax=Celeribacter baekdonensis B30 TaxID=1208323 RepID=K2JCN9_9RHOB|nr:MULTISPECIES: heme ABC exporter ATP-binding protein CcmA [Roseobacteraceae]EKE72818.1 cytochrome c biogenesis protein CcmA [Celeribacter baekdonensis B30]KAB6717928.1 heme ABC exporter ATP-binding protein CcmA [Roseobacter sp. TSBP12]|tara:strand:- start:19363 stop:19983 length:621 start_codon:yes stop_codon:yes gene_type:complete